MSSRASSPFNLSSQDVRDLVEGVDFDDVIREGSRPHLVELSPQEVAALLEGVDEPVPEWEAYRRPPLRMDFEPRPSTSRMDLGQAYSCVIPDLGRPEPIPMDLEVDGPVQLPVTHTGSFRITDEQERQ